MWFALIEGNIQGPFQKEDLEKKISGHSGILIWGKGQNAWVAPDKWRTFLLDQEKQTQSASEKISRQWRLAVENTEMPAMNYDEMIRFLKSKTDLSKIRVWTEGYSEWREIFQIHRIMDQLGVSRRAHPRVPLIGTLSCTGTSHGFDARLLSISEGGLGATDGVKVKIGAKFKVVIKSPNLPTQINATVEVVYVGNDGYFGMRFTALQSESQSIIIDYVKKFMITTVQEDGAR